MTDMIDVYYPAELEAAEAKLVTARREALRSPSQPVPAASARAVRSTRGERLPDDAIGMGLSGGGIRSATFCLGVFQALADARKLGEIDFLSTVSGGGYFGAFLGRLFTRPWIQTVDDVEKVLQQEDPTATSDSEQSSQPGWGARVFRWLRDNGRYLAPRGSGDVLLLGAILLRNWVAVQVVLVTTMLTVFLLLQVFRQLLEYLVGKRGLQLLVCDFPFGNSYLWWSPWILVALVPLLLIAVPTGWAYWLVVSRGDGKRGLSPVFGLILAVLLALAATIYYGRAAVSSNYLGLAISAAILVTGVLALMAFLVCRRHVSTEDTDAAHARNRLSQWLTTGLLATGAILGWALIDTIGATVYLELRAHGAYLSHWAAGVFSAFGGISAFARQLALLLSPAKGGTRPRVSLSIVSWAAAVVLLAMWLIAVNVFSHAIAWDFLLPKSAPSGLTVQAPPPPILGADHLVVAPERGGYVVRTALADSAAYCQVMPLQRPDTLFRYFALGVLLIFTVIFGHTLTFANLSTIHTFYAARLTRTFLGASNPSRLTQQTVVTETKPGDDCSSETYWSWPRTGKRSTGSAVTRPYVKGGPLHVVNTTVNETYDVRTGVQNQDRRGTGLAIGPCGLSLGIRHHLVRIADDVFVFPRRLASAAGEQPKDRRRKKAVNQEHRVFDESQNTPDPLTLGKWISISGAAFSAAAGANTTVPIAILAGLFNVRLGYWWDSGTRYGNGLFERLLPVQALLSQEMFARTHGTQGRRWNLSDGGHFENMGGYELIRRRLPIVVILDAEADPDYTFEGLSDLVRKARLDFHAEIMFATESQLSGDEPLAGRMRALVPASSRKYFGNLDALRRGKWSTNDLPYPPAPNNKQFAIEVDRSRTSRAHAAIARVEYRDGFASWLVYVKATLMGDEPEDVCHYHRLHPEFPHETTTDQFFDERQWESYRRLGLHVGHRVLTPELFDYLRMHPA